MEIKVINVIIGTIIKYMGRKEEQLTAPEEDSAVVVPTKKALESALRIFARTGDSGQTIIDGTEVDPTAQQADCQVLDDAHATAGAVLALPWVQRIMEARKQNPPGNKFKSGN